MTSPPADSVSTTQSTAQEGLGLLLARLRRARGRSQRRLADELCAAAGLATVSRHEISRWERGDRLPSEFWLAWLSEVLEVPPERLRRAVDVTRTRRAEAGSAGTGADPAGDPAATGTGAGAWPWRVLAFTCAEQPDGGVALVPVPMAPAGSRRTEPSGLRPVAPGLFAVT
jgi:transcriptional regulator with XRE-family HTH domain